MILSEYIGIYDLVIPKDNTICIYGIGFIDLKVLKSGMEEKQDGLIQ